MTRIRVWLVAICASLTLALVGFIVVVGMAAGEYICFDRSPWWGPPDPTSDSWPDEADRYPPLHISEFVSDQTKAGPGTETVRKIATLLGTIFASALKDELISANPARGVEKPKPDRDGVKPWEPDEVRIFLGRCAQHRLGGCSR